MRIGVMLASLWLWAPVAYAQFECSGPVCFSSSTSCEGYRGRLRDEGRAAPTCREAARMYCVRAWDVIEDEDATWCTSTRSACAGRIRDLQRINRRAHRHLYEGIGECEEIEIDGDGDGVRLGIDGCPDDAGPESTAGCPDTDGDSLPDRADMCPDVVGTVWGCPDRDADGVSDAGDDCPDVAGDQRYRGCAPPDADGDGVEDAVDRCGSVAGHATGYGCPDADGDGILDEEDLCPTVDPREGVPMTDGCPDADNDLVPDICFDHSRASARAAAVDEYRADRYRAFARLRHENCLEGQFADRCTSSPEDGRSRTLSDPARFDGCPER